MISSCRARRERELTKTAALVPLKATGNGRGIPLFRKTQTGLLNSVTAYLIPNDGDAAKVKISFKIR
jgi:hypothetical protein